MNHLHDIREWLRTTSLGGVLIPSTDEFLSEFAPPSGRRLRWVTGFRGSTGLAIILRSVAALFVDSRYRLQAIADVESGAIDIEPATLDGRRSWLRRHGVLQARIGLDPNIHSMPDVTQWRNLAAELGFELVMLAENPVDSLWKDGRPTSHRPPIVEYPAAYAGEDSVVKCKAIADHCKTMGQHALLVADQEDVSWLLNVRASGEALKTEVGDWHIVPSCVSRAMVFSDGRVTWFVDKPRVSPDLLRSHLSFLSIALPGELPHELRQASLHGRIGLDLNRTPAALTSIVEEAKAVCADDTVARRRWRKHALELQSARQAHVIDAAAVVRFSAWLTGAVRQQTVTEFEAAQKLEGFRAQHAAYRGASMPLMSASGPSAAQPHYVPRREACRRLNDHPVFWMDSGGQYPGGTTDNTITLAMGVPQPTHILAHTLVLQGVIALAMTRFPVGTSALRLDSIARQALWREGLDYGHGTGHGVGNYLSIHEGPVMSREPAPITTVLVEPGMIITNEPGFYAEGEFGVRIETHMVVVASRFANFLEFETISRLPIDPHLVDFSRLSKMERRWLADYHELVLRDLEPLLDGGAKDWLRGVAQAFIQAA